ncbi:MAG: V-type ATP synthase subunit E [Bilifractor sp.]|jgi:V/A-type H+-transporting ATPase subunit E
MAGVDTIIQQILDDANEKASGIIREAEEKAKAVTDAAEADVRKEMKRAQSLSEKESKDYEARVRSQIGMQKRQRLLAARRERVAEVIDRAYEQLKNLDADRYFSILENQIGRNAHAEDGEILLNRRDRERMPADFEKRADAIARKKGGSLKLSKESAEIEDGFVLRYHSAGLGDIDENCTFRALFEEKKEDLTDLACQILWNTGVNHE